MKARRDAGFWSLVAICAALLLLTLWTWSIPSPFNYGWMIAVLCWTLMVFGWTIWAIDAQFRRKLKLRPRHFVVPAFAFLAVVTAGSGWPFALRFEITESELTADAKSFIAEPKKAKGEHLIAGWDASYIDVHDDVVFISLKDSGFIDSYVLYFSESGEPPEEFERKLGDNWWLVYDEF